MSNGRQRPANDIDHELHALDCALRGEPVAAQHASLAQLAQMVRAARPQPSEAFVRALDARVAGGFQRARLRRPADRIGRRAMRWRTGLALAAAALIAAAVAVPLTLSGRGGHGAVTAVRSAPVPAAAAAAALAGSPGGEATAVRTVERAASLDLGVEPGSLQSTAQRVFMLASAFHGYVLQSNVSSGDGQQDAASFQLRLPAANLTSALAAFAQLGHVRSQTQSSNDVTEQLDALRRSLREARAQRARLLAQLAQVTDPQQRARLKAQLAAAEARIARSAAALHDLSGRVQYTTLALSLTAQAQTGGGSGLTLGGALHDASKILATALAVLVLVAAALLPPALLALAGWTALVLLRQRWRERALDAS